MYRGIEKERINHLYYGWKLNYKQGPPTLSRKYILLQWCRFQEHCNTGCRWYRQTLERPGASVNIRHSWYHVKFEIEGQYEPETITGKLYGTMITRVVIFQDWRAGRAMCFFCRWYWLQYPFYVAKPAADLYYSSTWVPSHTFKDWASEITGYAATVRALCTHAVPFAILSYKYNPRAPGRRWYAQSAHYKQVLL